MADIHEIAPDIYRISVYADAFDLQFNHFLVKDDEPLLYHTGMRGMFPVVREAVAKLIDPKSIRYIGWSHFEVDECGALNEWLDTAPYALPVCSVVGSLVNINDFSNRPPRGLQKEDVLETGKYRFRYISTPHLPHGWDAGSLFEERNSTLFCSDLFHQIGNVEPLTHSDKERHNRVSGGAADGLPPLYSQYQAVTASSRGAKASDAGNHARIKLQRRL